MHTDKGGSSVGFDAQLHPVYRKVRRTVSWRRPCASDLLRFGKCIWGASNLLFFCKRDAATSSELGLWNRICKSQPTILPRTLFVSHWALMKEFLRHSALWGIAALYLRNCTVWPFSSKFFMSSRQFPTLNIVVSRRPYIYSDTLTVVVLAVFLSAPGRWRHHWKHALAHFTCMLNQHLCHGTTLVR